jgi:hypothetical protein
MSLLIAYQDHRAGAESDLCGERPIRGRDYGSGGREVIVSLANARCEDPRCPVQPSSKLPLLQCGVNSTLFIRDQFHQ